MPFGNRPPLPGPRFLFGSGDDFAGLPEIVIGNRPVPGPWCLFGSGDDFAGLPLFLLWFTEGLPLCSKGNRPPLPAKCDLEVSLLEPVKKKIEINT